ncbi:MAG: hypothetical protein AAF657_02290 [Acidobacteriota bacterium]
MLLEEFLKPLEISQREFARHLGWTNARLNEIIKGRRGVGPGLRGGPRHGAGVLAQSTARLGLVAFLANPSQGRASEAASCERRAGLRLRSTPRITSQARRTYPAGGSSETTMAS